MSKTLKIDSDVLATLQEKAEKYEKLERLVAGFYVDDEGNEVQDEKGLDEIGEAVATFFRYL